MKRFYKILLIFSTLIILLFVVCIIPENKKKFRTQNFTFLFSSNIDSSSIAELSRALESSYKRVSDNLNTKPANNIEVNIYSQRWRYIKATGNWSASGSIEGTSKLHFLEDSWIESDIAKIAVHEFVHAVVLKLLIDMETDLIESQSFDAKFATFPVWLWEAISVYEARQFYPPKTLEYLNNGKYPEISELNTRAKGQKIYTCGYILIEYILRIYGKDKLIQLIQSYGDLENVLNISKEQFSSNWYKFIEDKYFN